MMTIKEKVKELWKLCFNDSDEFTELYFRLRYSNKVNITIQSGNEIISALQMIPYPMTFCGSVVNTSYISGACTNPEYRGKGVMRELLSQSFTQMTRKGFWLSTLIPAEPWLFDYYASMGYAPVFNYARRNIYPDDLIPTDKIEIDHNTEFDDVVYEYLKKKMMERSCCLQHDTTDYHVILEDLTLSGGSVFAAYDNDQVTGVAIAVPENKTLHVKELFADSQQIAEAILHRAAKAYKCTHISLITPVDEGEPIRKLGMCRIIYAKAILQLYAAAHPTKEMNIELTDNQISANNGYYYLVNGKCMTTKKRLPGAHLQLTIAQLAEMIFPPLNPYMSLMLN